MKYYVAIDGGGSKIAAILYDENLTPINSALSGSMNPTFSSKELLEHNAIKCAHDLMDGTGVEEIECVYGVFTRTVSDALAKVVKVNNLDDRGGEALIGLLAAFVSGDAITALSGTGSVVFYTHDNKCDEAGGYGSIIHDEGSGYYMGRLAFSEAIRDFEKRGPHTLISDCICKKLDAENIPHAASKIYEMKDKAPVAALASIAVCVGEAARMGDEVAARLLKECGENMADQTVGLIKRCNAPIDVPIVLSGGHWKNDHRMVDAFIAYVEKENPGRKIIVPYFEPIVGAVLVQRYVQGIMPDEQEQERLKELYAKFKYIIK